MASTFRPLCQPLNPKYLVVELLKTLNLTDFAESRFPTILQPQARSRLRHTSNSLACHSIPGHLHNMTEGAPQEAGVAFQLWCGS